MGFRPPNSWHNYVQAFFFLLLLFLFNVLFGPRRQNCLSTRKKKTSEDAWRVITVLLHLPSFPHVTQSGPYLQGGGQSLRNILFKKHCSREACSVFEFRYSNGLIIVTTCSAYLPNCHCVSDLAPSEMNFQASPPPRPTLKNSFFLYYIPSLMTLIKSSDLTISIIWMYFPASVSFYSPPHG